MKNNKVCIVTGASRGLGRGIALVLAQEEGCTVYATARNEEALKAVGEQRFCRTYCHDTSLWQTFLGKAPLCV